MSVRNLNEPDLSESLISLLKTWDAESDWLGIEVTESSVMQDPEKSISELDLLMNRGFRFFIDDFGVGYSSLRHLMQWPVDVIKIDHRFTSSCGWERGPAGGRITGSRSASSAANIGITQITTSTSLPSKARDDQFVLTKALSEKYGLKIRRSGLRIWHTTIRS
ncbi:EAL domain-containing protein [Noviherbaspirillum saxi]|uniref:EAL domain-containing protein n=1 Tax=Noviherbaspirillum saxi TaxID=2320863 RepID=A0A3A3G134_9BURK|nr:EAL domain-containing protein [Noviherbaspirillum saxi]